MVTQIYMKPVGYTKFFFGNIGIWRIQPRQLSPFDLIQSPISTYVCVQKQFRQMRKIVLFMHTSLDGFAAGPNGEMDWIHVDDEIFDYAGNQTDDADAALYGRVTYQMMDTYWPTAGDQPGASKHDIKHSKWYNAVNKIILSRSLEGNNLMRTTVISENIHEEIIRIKQQPGRNILIFGSPTAVRSLLQENLIDEFWFFVNPVVLGKGISFFNGVVEHLKLKLISSNAFSSGVVCLQYLKN
jgi:dihydrofolate reductase